MKFKQKLTERLKENATLRLLIENYGVRTIVTALGSVAINVVSRLYRRYGRVA